MEIYTSGFSEKFFKEYIERIRNIDKKSLEKVKETLASFEPPKRDQFGREIQKKKS